MVNMAALAFADARCTAGSRGCACMSRKLAGPGPRCRVQAPGVVDSGDQPRTRRAAGVVAKPAGSVGRRHPALTTVMALPGIPPGVLVALLYLVTAIQPAFDAARAAVTRDVLSGGLNETGSALMQVTYRLMMLAGAAVAGLAVAAAGPQTAVAADAATFLASAALIRAGVRARPPAASQATAPKDRHSEGRAEKPPWPGSALSCIQLVFRDPVLRTVMGLGWLAILYEVPEGIAAPYATAAGGSPAAAGLLIAAGQAMPHGGARRRHPDPDRPASRARRISGYLRCSRSGRSLPGHRGHHIRQLCPASLPRAGPRNRRGRAGRWAGTRLRRCRLGCPGALPDNGHGGRRRPRSRDRL